MRGSRSFSYSASEACTCTSMPTRSTKRARPHRPAGPGRHRSIEIVRCDAGLVEDANAVVEERDEHPVDDEPGRVVAANRALAEPLPHREGRLDGIVRRKLRAHDLDEGHQRRRVEEMHADDAFGRRRRRRDLGHGQRRRVRRENRVGPHDPLELPEQLSLRLEILDDRLDHEVAVGEGRRASVVSESEARAASRTSAVMLLLVDLALEEVSDPVTRRSRRDRRSLRDRRSRIPPRSRAARSPRPSRRVRRRRRVLISGAATTRRS